MQWSAAYCRTKGITCIQKPNRFSIHGMWPTNEIGSEPRRCSEDQAKKTLTRKMISTTTLAELPTSWPNLRGDNFKF
ncbi:hypothetical protein KIW84_020743 [Lathyrus oleraceus]|uniref:Uncharacterized protein n=1 Tax=Pisum sativum TaxID=3888 RepID=A0A9D4Y7X7_PEA|nr:hypothetical protein KIW84_020743 [Pisum sativum]